MRRKNPGTMVRAGVVSWRPLGGVLQLQDTADVYRDCIPGPALCFGDVFILHLPPYALLFRQERVMGDF